MSVRIQELTNVKVASKVWTCPTYSIDAKALNALLDEGWLIEGTEVISETYVVRLKQEAEARKVFFVDVADLPPNEVANHIESVRERVVEAEDDLYVPVRK